MDTSATRRPRSALSALSIVWLLPAALPACAWHAPAAPAAADTEHAAVASTVERYFEERAAAGGDQLRPALPPAVGTSAPEPSARQAPRKRRILSIDIAGQAAVAKVDLDYAGAHLVNRVALLNLDGDWVVVTHHVFHPEAGATAPAPAHAMR